MFRWFFLLLFTARAAFGAEPTPDVLKDISIQPNLGSTLPLDEEFVDESGQAVKLASYFDGTKPVVLIMNYYGCPMLCGIILNAARDGFQGMDWLPGQHYRVVTISIDPKEGADLAAAKKNSVVGSFKKPEFRAAAAANWHFLVGKNGSEARVAKALGFRYKWIEEEQQFAHGAALFLASPRGKLTRVLPGIDFPARDLKLAMLEASEGKVGSFAEKLLLFCYHYEPKENKYSLLASRLVSIGGAITVAALLLAYGLWFLRSRWKGKACSRSP